MQTLLDTAHSLLLESIQYNDNGLKIEFLELFRNSEPENIQISNDITINDAYAIGPNENSKKFIVHFEEILTWQVVDESAYCFDENEILDSNGFLKVVGNSDYMKYVQKQFGWYEHMSGKTQHFRIWSENRIVDVISTMKPQIWF
ncbi:hypothetical protein [Fluviicola chungangensis]|uniref:Uncharacterized protein n=1 Tax=Fluviicola chungangensis TaxID=2597671 RepID=A0A556MJS2_9FLAO|nr:hypothetical protein [Fluviicola chungangensis]TSJ40075.1 hypothetical protein FO442_15870 [Fluviicola chungangensis]